MKQLLLSLILATMLTSTFAKDKKSKPDIVLKKYKARINRIKNEYKKSIEILRGKMITDYKAYQKLLMKKGDLKGANKTQAKLEALENKSSGVTNKEGETGDEFNFDVQLNEDKTEGNKTSKKKIEFETNIAPEATITASSSHRGSKPSNLTNGRTGRNFQAMWVTQQEGVGAWVQFSWKKPRIISKITILPNNHPNTHIDKAHLIFNGKSKVNIDSFPKSPEEFTVNLKRNVRAKTIRIKVTKGVINKFGLGIREVKIYGSKK